MCIHSKYITNRYIGKRILVRCGKCDACKQEKAAAYASRIRNASKFGFVPVMVTLTYSNDFVPYVFLDDLNKVDIPVYRDYSIVSKFGVRSIVPNKEPVDIVFNELSVSYVKLDGRKGVKCLKHSNDKVGVLLYKDLQDFFKRLRIYLKRNFNYEDKIIYWSASEYGSKSLRPHFHCICYVKSDSIKAFRRSVIACWAFSDWSRPQKSIQVARNAASYVASYVNRGSCFPKVLENSVFKPRHSMSKGFGADVDLFNLVSLLAKVERRDLRFNIQSFRNGERVNTAVLVPKYVINRYFPRFKGDYLILDDEIREFLLVPSRIRFIVYVRNRSVMWSHDDYYRISVMINNCFHRFMSELNLSFDEAFVCYSIYYSDIWRCYHSNVIRYSYESVESLDDLSDFYENSNMLSLPRFVSDLQDLDIDWQFDPNKRKDVVDKSVNMSFLYNSMSKYRDLNNLALSSLYNDF